MGITTDYVFVEGIDYGFDCKLQLFKRCEFKRA